MKILLFSKCMLLILLTDVTELVKWCELQARIQIYLQTINNYWIELSPHPTFVFFFDNTQKKIYVATFVCHFIKSLTCIMIKELWLV